MKDFIFIIGPSGVGKTTLAKELFKHYKGVYFEQNMIPEFHISNNVDEGKYEEEVLWESSIELLKYFYNKGLKNVIALDFNDIRTKEIPIIFKGKNFITLKLICSDYEQIKDQMISRGKKGLIDLKLLKISCEKITNRELLPNEVLLDVAGKSAEKVLKEAINIIDNYESKMDYTYIEPSKELFYSWVQSDGLRE
ncbi:MAG: hypothetical protein GX951_00105 [Mollicutes bacterium]|nr:hypothetical protein [Mollicutes bacterium]